MAKQYEDFAFVYDELMNDVPYEQWVKFIISAFNQSNQKINLVAELGCGTGNITIPLAQSGYEMIGIDCSQTMLMVSREKAEEADVHPLLLLQDMVEFELFGTVDAIIAPCDSLNYLSSAEKLQKVFSLVHNYLNDDGVFIFDVNTEYRFEKVYGNQTFTYRDDEVAYIWENSYNPKKKANTYDISFFVMEEDHTYLRFDEYHKEYAYSQECIKEMLDKEGLTLIGLYDDYSWSPVKTTTERLTFIVKK